MFSLQTFGVEAVAAYLSDGVRLFKLEQRKKIREAANAVKADVVAKVESIFGSGHKRHKSTAGKPLGPLARQIGVRVFFTTADVVALIRPNAKAFYGRFQETGLNTMRKGRVVGHTTNLFGRKKNIRATAHPFVLPRKPFLEPVATADENKVADIMGESYGVFYRGGA